MISSQAALATEVIDQNQSQLTLCPGAEDENVPEWVKHAKNLEPDHPAELGYSKEDPLLPDAAQEVKEENQKPPVPANQLGKEGEKTNDPGDQIG